MENYVCQLTCDLKGKDDKNVMDTYAHKQRLISNTKAYKFSAKLNILTTRKHRI